MILNIKIKDVTKLAILISIIGYALNNTNYLECSPQKLHASGSTNQKRLKWSELGIVVEMLISMNRTVNVNSAVLLKPLAHFGHPSQTQLSPLTTPVRLCVYVYPRHLQPMKQKSSRNKKL